MPVRDTCGHCGHGSQDSTTWKRDTGRVSPVQKCLLHPVQTPLAPLTTHTALPRGALQDLEHIPRDPASGIRRLGGLPPAPSCLSACKVVSFAVWLDRRKEQTLRASEVLPECAVPGLSLSALGRPGLACAFPTCLPTPQCKPENPVVAWLFLNCSGIWWISVGAKGPNSLRCYTLVLSAMTLGVCLNSHCECDTS